MLRQPLRVDRPPQDLTLKIIFPFDAFLQREKRMGYQYRDAI